MAIEFLKSKKTKKLYHQIKNSLLVSQKETKKTKKKTLNDKDLNDYKLNEHELFYISRTKNKNHLEYIRYRKNLKRIVDEKIYTAFPQYLLIEPTSICNLRCVMCFQQDKSFSSNKKYMGMMDIELFKRVIDQAEVGGTKSITLASRGEPTLHKKFPEMLDYIKGKFLEVKQSEN